MFGRENDDTGLYFYRARYYDAVLKRFVWEDPIGLAGGVNTYAYVRGSPLRYIDPMGLFEMYGNWGGANWSGGSSGSRIPKNPLSPKDSLDECFMRHDYCYQMNEDNGQCNVGGLNKDVEKACDLALLQCMRNLPSNTNDWESPPTNLVYGQNQNSPGADNFRRNADNYFGWK